VKTPAARPAVWFLLAGLALFGCAPTPERLPAGPERAMPNDYPLSVYQEALAKGRNVYRIVPEQSEIVIRVFRGGGLARLGHNHTVASRDVRGHAIVTEPFADSRFDLYFPVTALIVDDPGDRAAAGAGFDTQPSDKAVQGTRANLLGPSQLDAGDHPFITIAGGVASGGPPRPELNLELTVRGVTVSRVIPVELRVDGGHLIASGELSLRQSELGIEPYSVLGGALRVQDVMDLRFRIVGERAESRGRLGARD
jgi:hypothetical protein